MISTTLEKAFQIIEYVGEQQPVQTIDIQRHTGITKGNVYRLIATLEHLGYVQKGTNGYTLSFKMFALGNTVPVTRDVVGIARPFLESITNDFGVSSYISIRDRTQMVNLDRVRPKIDVSISDDFAISYDLHCTASGKLALAHIPPRARSEMYDRIVFTPRTDQTIIDVEVIEEEILKIRAKGYATEHREHGPNINGVAAPVYDHTGGFAASLSAAAPAMILTEERVETLGVRLATDAAKLSALMGYRG